MKDRLRRVGRRISPVQAGLIAIAIAAIAVYVAFGGALPWESSYQLRALVSSGNELHSRTPVRIAGVDVGKISGVSRGPGTTMDVTMDISPSLPQQQISRWMTPGRNGHSGPRLTKDELVSRLLSFGAT